MTFPMIQLQGELRPAQREIARIARDQIGRGERRLHVVAPPGSGKTVLGLHLWASLAQKPALVLSPNTAIQAQWLTQLELFQRPADLTVSTESKAPGLLTSLTYQAVTLPARGSVEIEQLALTRWAQRLVERKQAETEPEARDWIRRLEAANPRYHAERLAIHTKAVRDQQAQENGALPLLHDSSLEAVEALRAAAVGLVVFDECHHLLGHWGRALSDIVQALGPETMVLGLTATPPDLERYPAEDAERYRGLFGPIDYQVPIPALVKDGFLAPYQDLVYFVRPDPRELAFLESVDRSFHDLVQKLCAPEPPTESLPHWLQRVLAQRQLTGKPVKTWSAFERKDRPFAVAARRWLLEHGFSLPTGVPGPPGREDTESLDDTMTVLDRYIRHGLRLSKSPQDHTLAEEAVARLRVLGVQITETGSRPCASPVSRILSYSMAKNHALVPILKAEMATLGDRIRAVVVTDFERSSATAAELEGILDAEAGGAVAAFRAVLSDPETDALDPVLVTGSSVLVDDDLAEKFMAAARDWMRERALDAELEYEDVPGFKILHGRGEDWSPQSYVRLATDLFDAGLVRCLVGTRGLLGEGWDTRKANVLLDLTTVTTVTSVNQLRGRTLRIDPQEPQKLSDNWDVVCLAPELTRGLADYQRFAAKHHVLLGVTEDGTIESGAGHVHASFTEMEPEGLEKEAGRLNREMLRRAGRRHQSRARWRIGERYRAEVVPALELQVQSDADSFTGYDGEPWSATSLALLVARAVHDSLAELGRIEATSEVHVGQRSAGYLVVYLKNARVEDARVFSRNLREALGPLDKPRYVISRRHLEGDLDFVMYHAVPAEFSKSRQTLELYKGNWNAYVSPGRPIFVARGEGQKLLDDAIRAGRVPGSRLREKQAWL